METAFTSDFALGVVAAALNLVAYVPYIRDISAGRTRPQRITWLMYAITATVALGSQLSLGAGPGVLISVSQTAAVLVVVALSIRKGTGGTSKFDLGCLGLAIMALALWQLANAPALAIAASVAVGVVATAPTLLKAVVDPGSETKSTWLLGAVAACISLAASINRSPVTLIYPGYLVIMNVTMCVLLFAAPLAVARRLRSAT